VPDEIESWAWLEKEVDLDEDLSAIQAGKIQKQGFRAGIEIQHRFHPSWMTALPGTLADIQAINANWLVLTPGWTLTRQNPPVIEPVNGQNPTWMQEIEMIRLAGKRDLKIALRPIPHFPGPQDQWWQSAARDFAWWVSWFDRYQDFVLHFADLAEQEGVDTLILGGDWMSPAFPSGMLADGTTSGVPPDADDRYRNLISLVREHFNGNIAWAFDYPQDLINPNGFLQDVDLLYVLWNLPLSEGPNPSYQDLKASAEGQLSKDLYATYLTWQMGSQDKNIIISLSYPSVEGGTMGCLADPMADCIDPQSLNYPAPDLPLHEVDMAVQAKAYHAMLDVISQSGWIDGVTSRGYYVPTILHDKSTSIHGKPAEVVLAAWFSAINTP
jgi:hypothetical protein